MTLPLNIYTGAFWGREFEGSEEAQKYACILGQNKISKLT